MLTHDTPATPIIVDRHRIAATVTLPAAVAAVESAFRGLARGRVAQPPPMGLNLPGGEIHVKSAQLGPGHPVVIKIASGFPGNTSQGLPTGDGAMLVLDSATGQVRTVLLDGGWLTDVRTAAATAVAVRHLASSSPRRLALLGTGVQADLTMRTLAAVKLLPPDVAVWGRDLARAGRLADRHRTATTRLAAVASASAAVRDADLVITVTAARVPVLHGAWLAANAIVIAVGADSPGKRECDSEVLRRATRIIVDRREQAIRLGELQHLPPHVLEATNVVELRDLVTNPATRSTQGIQLCDLTGLGAADAAVAEIALDQQSNSCGKARA